MSSEKFADERRATLVVSDLHVGGGAKDPGDDHIYQGGELETFIREQRQSADGDAGRLELIFNGDFFEFAQTDQKAYSGVSDELWCSEHESCRKLTAILEGHSGIFGELAKFAARGNVVTLAAGNHDVDLYWPEVQAQLRKAIAPGIRFELGSEWYTRHGGLLQISHGHIPDPANSFEHWSDPIRAGAWGLKRLEMCPGTLFMVKFVNKLEAQYPFADNLHPVTKLVSVLLRDDKAGFGAVAWMFGKFVASTSHKVLGGQPGGRYGEVLMARFHGDPGFAAKIRAVLESAGDSEILHSFDPQAFTEEMAARLMFRLLGRIDDQKWHELFDAPAATTLGGERHTLGKLFESQRSFGRDSLREVAQARRKETGARVIVMGHTHLPDIHELDDGAVYFNPGSWTRYLELEDEARVTLEDLVDESRYPYELNYVRVDPASAGGGVRARMHCFKTNKPQPTPGTVT